MQLLDLRVGVKDDGTEIDPGVAPLGLLRRDHYQLQLTITVILSEQDLLGEHRASVHVRDPAGGILNPQAGEHTFDVRQVVDVRLHTLPVITTVPLLFTRAGTYLIDVIMDGRLLGVVPVVIKFEG